jgi:caffeoyl-CoA O-methyltransferase
MEITDPALAAYAEQHSTVESNALKAINRDTHVNVLMPRMLSGHLQGRLLSMISKLVSPMRILEIGTYTGYSAICLAEGLRDGGKLITIDKNAELEPRVRKNLALAGVTEVVDLRFGNAQDILPSLGGPFDLVFIDADKERYSLYFDLVIDKVRSGGVVLADNVLWSGKVLDAKPDKDTKAIVEFNAKVNSDPRVENVLLPIRDGIMVARKIA